MKIKKQGRDLNVLKSLNKTGIKLVEKIIPNKKKIKRVKHKKQIFE